MALKKSSAPVRLAVDILYDLIGGLIYAVALVCFVAPANIAPGGVSGIAVIINHLTGLPLGTLTMVMNLPLLVLGWRFLGRGFTLRTLKSVAIQTLLTDLLAVHLPVYQGEPMLAALFGGVGIGVGLALVFMRGSTTGGTDIVSRLIQRRFRHVPIGKMMLLVDLGVLAASMLVFQNLEVGLYGMITIFTASRLVDSLLFGLYTGKLVLIISGKDREICREIMDQVGRGVTFLKGEGGYSGQDKQVLLCAVRPPEYHRVEEIVKALDPDAFTITLEATEIMGEGFRAITEDKVT